MIKNNTSWSINWVDILIIVILILSPLLINLIITVVMGFTCGGSSDGWLAFYGGLVGAIITLYVLFKTIQKNHSENQRNMLLQFSFFHYQQERQKVDTLQTVLYEFQTTFDVMEALTAVEKIRDGDFKSSVFILKKLTRDIDSAAFRIDLLLPKTAITTAHIHFTNIYNRIFAEYGLLLTDLIFFADLMRNMPQDYEKRNSYMLHHLREDLDKVPKTESESIISILKQYDPTQIGDNMLNILSDRVVCATDLISDEKENLKEAIVDLIKEKQNEIESRFVPTETHRRE